MNDTSQSDMARLQIVIAASDVIRAINRIGATMAVDIPIAVALGRLEVKVNEYERILDLPLCERASSGLTK